MRLVTERVSPKMDAFIKSYYRETDSGRHVYKGGYASAAISPEQIDGDEMGYIYNFGATPVGLGYGARALLHITGLADKHGVKLGLSPGSPRLGKMYSKAGFLYKEGEYGRGKDNLMVREPRKKVESRADALIKQVLTEGYTCPNCQSPNIDREPWRFGAGKAAAGFFLAGPIGLAAGLIGAKRGWRCKGCGAAFAQEHIGLSPQQAGALKAQAQAGALPRTKWKDISFGDRAPTTAGGKIRHTLRKAGAYMDQYAVDQETMRMRINPPAPHLGHEKVITASPSGKPAQTVTQPKPKGKIKKALSTIGIDWDVPRYK